MLDDIDPTGKRINDFFANLRKGVSPAKAAGLNLEPPVCADAHELGDWFVGFAAACKAARP